MKRKNNNIPLVGDFETTVYDGQEYTAVWRSALVELFTENVKIFGDIDKTFDYLLNLEKDVTVYYHNLKFDGSFWLDYLKRQEEYTEKFIEYPTGVCEQLSLRSDPEKEPDRALKPYEYTYLISDIGQWYYIAIRTPTGNMIMIQDSLKLMPLSVKDLGEGYKTKHRKLNIEYTGYREPNGYISDVEKEYISNDVLVVKECLEAFYNILNNDENNNVFNPNKLKMTIGSNCLSEFKKTQTSLFEHADTYTHMFPDLYDMTAPDWRGSLTAGEFIEGAYRGGWCYLKKGKDRQVVKGGCTADVNSLYPSVMHSQSGNRYPIDRPQWVQGDEILNFTSDDMLYTYIKVKTRFKLKEGYLPFIQIKNNILYNPNEMLESSDIFKNGEYYSEYTNLKGEIVRAIPILTLSKTDWLLINEHYELYDTEIIGGCYFQTEICIFDKYINKHMREKRMQKGARRQVAKLFLNNLYGKFATSTKADFKRFIINEDNALQSTIVKSMPKEGGYIAVGRAITSYARDFTIRHAQKNYDTFIYADTDSIHCCCKPEDLINIRTHDTDLLAWKIENTFDTAWYLRKKRYIEIDGNDYIIKCAGMPEKSKDLFIKSLTHDEDYEGLNEEEIEFCAFPRSLEDFDVGLSVPGKKVPKLIPGGTVLQDIEFTIKPDVWYL